MSYSVFGTYGNSPGGFAISPGEGFGSSNMTSSLHHIINDAIGMYIQNMMVVLIMELISSILQSKSIGPERFQANGENQQDGQDNQLQDT